MSDIFNVHKAPERKTKFTTVLTDINGELVSLISSLPNQFVKECIELNQLSFLNGLKIKKQEISYTNQTKP